MKVFSLVLASLGATSVFGSAGVHGRSVMESPEHSRYASTPSDAAAKSSSLIAGADESGDTLVEIGAKTTRSEKRLADPGRLPSFRGGGLLNKRKLASLPIARDFSFNLLEEGEGVGAGEGETPTSTTPPPELPEKYIFLADPRYSQCYESTSKDQGECNTCWAFATQKMMQARLCKWNADSGMRVPLESLSPMNLICKIQSVGEVCVPRDIGSVLSYVQSTGILSEVWMSIWTGRAKSRVMINSVRRLGVPALRRARQAEFEPEDRNPWRDKDRDGEYYENQVTVDLSQPKRESCTLLFNDPGYSGALVPGKPMVTTAPHSLAKLKRLLLNGPVIATIRLSWEFMIFKGSLFNPEGTMTFCRVSRTTDANDFCDPSKANAWDEEQRIQQARPASMSVEDWQDTWYNHFVAVHGWGVNAEGVKYLVIENSWGDIYANDATQDNNGAGPQVFSRNELTEFVLIAETIAGARGLEMTTRELFYVTKPKASLTPPQ